MDKERLELRKLQAIAAEMLDKKELSNYDKIHKRIEALRRRITAKYGSI